MSSLSQAPRLGDLPSPHGAFQEHAAHVARWPATLRSKGSLGTCIPKVLRHSYIALSRRTDNGHYVNLAILDFARPPPERVCMLLASVPMLACPRFCPALRPSHRGRRALDAPHA